MLFSEIKRLLLIGIVNVSAILILLATTELTCRYFEQRSAERSDPALRKLSPKHNTEIRVFAFGASTVWGEPVPQVAFLAQMQYWFSRLYPDREIKIYNFGERGKDTAWVLKQVIRRFDDRPDLIIVITGGNEFLWWEPEKKGWMDRERDKLYSQFATMRVLQRVAQRLNLRDREFMPCQLEPWDRDSPVFKNRIAAFTQNLRSIVEHARAKRVPLILATSPSNISDWPPVYTRLSGRDHTYLETVSHIRKLIEEGTYVDASAAVVDAFRVYRDDAMLYFLRGKLEARNGEYAEARDSFVKARDLDPFPWRASSEINSVIRNTALGTPGVYLIDLEREYENHARHGLVGFDLFFDNVHGTPEAESITAQTMIRTMEQFRFLPPIKIPGECCTPDAFLAKLGYFQPKSPLHLRALLDTATFVMKTPFFNYQLSRKYLDDAMKVDDSSWQVWANLATLAYLGGDTVTGEEDLERATNLHHGALDVNNREATPYLKEALAYSSGQGRDCGDVDQGSLGNLPDNRKPVAQK